MWQIRLRGRNLKEYSDRDCGMSYAASRLWNEKDKKSVLDKIKHSLIERL